MDGYAVIIAFGLTQLLRALLPTPTGSSRIAGVSFAVSGWGYRILPYIPLLIGILVVVIKDGWISPTMKLDDAFVKGMVSGIAAAYVYRTIKITIFGKPSKEEENEPKENNNIGGVVKTILG
jgi:hypothetical protein